MRQQFKTLHLTTNTLDHSDGFRQLIFQNENYTIEFTYKGDYAAHKKAHTIDMRQIRCIIFNKMFLPKLSYNVSRNQFSIDASASMEAHMFSEKDITSFIAQMQESYDVIKQIETISNQYFRQYADTNIDYVEPSESERKFHEMLVSGKLYELIGLDNPTKK